MCQSIILVFSHDQNKPYISENIGTCLGRNRAFTRQRNCSAEMKKFWDDNVALNTSVFIIKMGKPSGKECLSVFYRHKIIALNNVKIKTRVSRVQYVFNTLDLFGLNITFIKFSLSDYCFINRPYEKNEFRPCYYHLGTEYVLLNQSSVNKGEQLYFCMKRPQFSIYTNYKILLEYSLCHICNNYKSYIVFQYQVLDRNVFVTIKDDYGKLYYLSPKMNTTVQLLQSIVCVIWNNNCVQNVISLFLIARKCHSIKLQSNCIQGRIFVKVGITNRREVLFNSQSLTASIFFV